MRLALWATWSVPRRLSDRALICVGITFDKILVTSGSGGTHSGLLLGLREYNYDVPAVGVYLSIEKASQKEICCKESSIKPFPNWG